MYLLEGKPVPDYATFARFRSIHFATVCETEFSLKCLIFFMKLGEISGESIFIDRHKKSKPVRINTHLCGKKAVTKNQEKLLIKIADLIAECEQLYGIQIVYGDTVKMKL